MTKGAMLADVSWSVPFRVTGLKLLTVGSPAPLSNAGGSAGARAAVATASSAAAMTAPRILVGFGLAFAVMWLVSHVDGCDRFAW